MVNCAQIIIADFSGKSQFEVYMDALNAGRTDADHYDPEDFTHPEDWQIDDKFWDVHPPYRR